MNQASLTEFGLPQPTDEERHGHALYGDGFGPEQLAIWFRNEENGYFALQRSDYVANNDDGFEYLAADTFHFDRRLKGRHFPVCLAVGCADGADVAPFAGHVDRFIAVEPARSWWRPEIGGKPADYRAPNSDGSFDIADDSVDLATVYGVLHHIPKVSATIAEVARVLKPGGVLLLREPVVSMGDFTKPRVGLTAHERGIPAPLLVQMLADNGLALRYRSPTRFNAFFMLLQKLGINSNTQLAVRADSWISRLSQFNLRYWRSRPWHKLSPSGIAIIAEKRAKTG